jgi:hypothetical protein
MMAFLSKHKLLIAGVFIGALTGYLYYYFVGCSSGTCAITSKPFNSSAYGAVMGGLIFSTFNKNK